VLSWQVNLFEFHRDDDGTINVRKKRWEKCRKKKKIPPWEEIWKFEVLFLVAGWPLVD